MLAESKLDDNAVKKMNMALVIDYSIKDKTVLVAIGQKRVVIDTYLQPFKESNYRHNDIKKEFTELLNSIDNDDLDGLLNIGDTLIKEDYISLVKPLKYLDTVYKIIKENDNNQLIKELKKMCVNIVKDVTIRAMRERHSEVIISEWLNHDDKKEHYHLLWNRLNKIGATVFTGNPEIDSDIFRAIENFNNIALPLRSVGEQNEIINISKALMIAIGQHDNIILQDNVTPIVSSLIKLGVKVIKEGIDVFNKDLYIDNVQDLIKKCNLNGYFYLRKNLLNNNK